MVEGLGVVPCSLRCRLFAYMLGSATRLVTGPVLKTVEHIVMALMSSTLSTSAIIQNVKSNMIVQAPLEYFKRDKISVFLAGTIDNGESIDWQASLSNEIQEEFPKVNIYNPRRADWDKDATVPDLIEQIRWEQKYLNQCSILFFNILANSVSPVTLLELGQALGRGKEVVIACSSDYFRYWNVRATALEHDRIVYTSYEQAVKLLKRKLTTRLE